MVAVEPAQGTLNFVVCGNVRCGASVVQSAITSRNDAVCHTDVFHPNKDVRQAAHENYFGPAHGPNRSASYYEPELVSPFQYLSHSLFDNPVNGEKAIGVLLRYHDITRYELDDFFAARHREGDFCLIHVTRNPVACYISLKQAEQSQVWCRFTGARPNRVPMPLGAIDHEELTQFVRNHMACLHRIKAACSDALNISYYDLCTDYRRTMARVFDFIELPVQARPALSGYARMKNRAMRQRILDIDRLRTQVPYDVGNWLDAEDFH